MSTSLSFFFHRVDHPLSISKYQPVFWSYFYRFKSPKMIWILIYNFRESKYCWWHSGGRNACQKPINRTLHKIIRVNELYSALHWNCLVSEYIFFFRVHKRYQSAEWLPRSRMAHETKGTKRCNGEHRLVVHQGHHPALCSNVRSICIIIIMQVKDP